MLVDFIYSIPDLLLYVLISLVALIFSLTSLILIRRFVPAQILHQGHEAVDPTSATISVAYAIVVGLMSITVLNNFDKAGAIVQDEANAVADIYRYAQVLPPATRIKIQGFVKKYINTVIQKEWPDMQKGIVNKQGNPLIDELLTILIQEAETDHTIKQSLIFNEISQHINRLHEIKLKREILVKSALEYEAWIVIIIGALLVLGINCLYGINFYLHLTIMVILTLALSLVVFLTVALDNPFRGTAFSIQPDAFRTIYDDLKLNTANP